MSLTRREMLMSVAAGVTGAAITSVVHNTRSTSASASSTPTGASTDLSDWKAVRDLFPLANDWVHLAAFLFVSHPRPVQESIAHFRAKIDNDPFWIELAAFTDSEGKPYEAIKKSLASYIGGEPLEICITNNTTGALAVAYHGLRIRRDQEIITTEHDHYSQHESIRYAAARSGCAVRYIRLYEKSSQANADQMVQSIERAITPKTRAVGVTWVHSSTGVKLPIQQIAAVVARANSGRAAADRCLLIVDGVHGFANQDVDAAKLGADFFASGTHKWLFAPRGTGFLWGKSDAWQELRPTVPAFDPDGLATWEAWMERKELPTMTAAFAAPGGFQAYEHLLAIPAAVKLHEEIGRARIAARIAELNNIFRQEAVKLPKVTLHTPLDPSLSGGFPALR